MVTTSLLAIEYICCSLNDLTLIFVVSNEQHNIIRLNDKAQDDSNKADHSWLHNSKYWSKNFRGGFLDSSSDNVSFCVTDFITFDGGNEEFQKSDYYPIVAKTLIHVE